MTVQYDFYKVNFQTTVTLLSTFDMQEQKVVCVLFVLSYSQHDAGCLIMENSSVIGPLWPVECWLLFLLTHCAINSFSYKHISVLPAKY